MARTRAPRSHADVVAVAEEFAASVKPGAAERDRAGAVPRAEVAEFDKLGLPAITVPIDDGGDGLAQKLADAGA